MKIEVRRIIEFRFNETEGVILLKCLKNCQDRLSLHRLSLYPPTETGIDEMLTDTDKETLKLIISSLESADIRRNIC